MALNETPSSMATPLWPITLQKCVVAGWLRKSSLSYDWLRLEFLMLLVNRWCLGPYASLFCALTDVTRVVFKGFLLPLPKTTTTQPSHRTNAESAGQTSVHLHPPAVRVSDLISGERAWSRMSPEAQAQLLHDDTILLHKRGGGGQGRGAPLCWTHPGFFQLFVPFDEGVEVLLWLLCLFCVGEGLHLVLRVHTPAHLLLLCFGFSFCISPSFKGRRAA